MKLINFSGHRILQIVCVLCCSLAVLTLAWGQDARLSNEKLAQNLIVKITGDMGEAENNIVGAGIIVAQEGDFVYLATADHVIRRGLDEARNLKVQFRFWPGSSITAKLLENRSQKLDFAMLRVNLRDSEMTPERFRQHIHFDQVGYVTNTEEQLHLRDELYPIGHPGIDWHIALNPGKFRQVVDRLTIRFEYDCEQGHSGGGVFTEKWDLVGMLQSQFGKDCEALSIEGIRAKLDEWGLPMNLSPLSPQKRLSRKIEEVPPTPTPIVTVPPEPESTPFPTKMMLQVEAGNYKISPYLQQYVRYALSSGLLNNPIIIDQSFSIQVGEVTVEEFRKYVESLDETSRQRVGSWWEKASDGSLYEEQRPVDNITWEEASNYAVWLSQQSGREFLLTSLEQWIAACVKYAEEFPILRKTYDQPSSKLRDQIDHLLGNLREFSSSSCGGGVYRLLGENYRTKAESIGEENCIPVDVRWPGVGFRLITIEE